MDGGVELYRDHGIVLYQVSNSYGENTVAVLCAPCSVQLIEKDPDKSFYCYNCDKKFRRKREQFPKGWFGAKVWFNSLTRSELEKWVQVWLSGRGWDEEEVKVSIEWPK